MLADTVLPAERLDLSPASASLSTPTICSSVNRLFRLSPSFARGRLAFQVAAFAGVRSRRTPRQARQSGSSHALLGDEPAERRLHHLQTRWPDVIGENATSSGCRHGDGGDDQSDFAL